MEGEGINWETGTDISHTILYIRKITNKENSTQYLEMAYMGKESLREKINVHT